MKNDERIDALEKEVKLLREAKDKSSHEVSLEKTGHDKIAEGDFFTELRSGFVDGIDRTFKFSGKTNRMQYFSLQIVWFVIFFIVVFIYELIAGFVREDSIIMVILVLLLGGFLLFYLVSIITATVRRLRDAGFGWGWIFLAPVGYLMCFVKSKDIKVSPLQKSHEQMVIILAIIITIIQLVATFYGE